MKPIYFLLLPLAGLICLSNEHDYLFKIKNCEYVMVPGDVKFKKKVVGSIHRIISMKNNECIVELKIQNGFIVTNAMSFHYKKVFVGDSYFEIAIDSAKVNIQKEISTKDTITIY